jgi:hypothetical protein
MENIFIFDSISLGRGVRVVWAYEKHPGSKVVKSAGRDRRQKVMFISIRRASLLLPWCRLQEVEATRRCSWGKVWQIRSNQCSSVMSRLPPCEQFSLGLSRKELEVCWWQPIAWRCFCEDPTAAAWTAACVKWSQEETSEEDLRQSCPAQSWRSS